MSLIERKTTSLTPRSTPVRIPGRFPAGRYEFLRRLGRGSFGEVWIAEDKRAQQKVVIKRLYKKEDEGFEVTELEDALVEANALQRLHDVCTEGTVPCFYDLYQDDNYYFLVEQLLGGRWVTMDDYIANAYPTECKDDWIIAQNLIDAVRVLHRYNVVSRDLKTENVFVNLANCHVKIGDFGLSCVGEAAPAPPPMRTRRQLAGERVRATAEEKKLQGRKSDPNRISVASAAQRRQRVPIGQCGKTCIGYGTPGYISPETLRNTPTCYYGLEAAKRTDIWSTGWTVAYLILKYDLFKKMARDVLRVHYALQRSRQEANQEPDESALERQEQEEKKFPRRKVLVKSEPIVRPARVRRPPTRFAFPVSDGWFRNMFDGRKVALERGPRTLRRLAREARRLPPLPKQPGVRTLRRLGREKNRIRALEQTPQYEAPEEKEESAPEEEERESQATKEEEDEEEEEEPDVDLFDDEQMQIIAQALLFNPEPLPLSTYIKDPHLLRVLLPMLDKNPITRRFPGRSAAP